MTRDALLDYCRTHPGPLATAVVRLLTDNRRLTAHLVDLESQLAQERGRRPTVSVAEDESGRRIVSVDGRVLDDVPPSIRRDP